MFLDLQVLSSCFRYLKLVVDQSLCLVQDRLHSFQTLFLLVYLDLQEQ